MADEAVNSGGDQTPGTADDVRWTLTDHQNSLRDLVAWDDVNNEWHVVNHITYDSYGNANAAVDCLFGFTGRLFDSATGLQNNLNRWYDPEVGRWLSEDPIGFEGGDANLYRYVANDPGNITDSIGLKPTRMYDLMKEFGTVSEPAADLADDLMTAHDVTVAAAEGVGHGAAMIANAATFHQVNSLDSYVDDLVETNGGLYEIANVAANVGVAAGYSVAAIGLYTEGAVATLVSKAYAIAEYTLQAVVGGTTMVCVEGYKFAFYMVVNHPYITLNITEFLFSPIETVCPEMIQTTPGGVAGVYLWKYRLQDRFNERADEPSR